MWRLLLAPVGVFTAVAGVVLKFSVDKLEQTLPPTQKYVMFRTWRSWFRGLLENSKLHKYRVFYLAVVPVALLLSSCLTVLKTPALDDFDVLISGGGLYFVFLSVVAAAVGGFIFGYGLFYVSQPCKTKNGMTVVPFA